MLVGLGLAIMMLATYGLFAWQFSLDRITALFVAGICLIAAQFLRIQRKAVQPLTTVESKGEIDGSH
jgi:uncharacterized membrane protein YhiD involved in acid resistance